MNQWSSDLRNDLRCLEAQEQLRRVPTVESHGRLIRLDGAELVNLAGNDYLALAQHSYLRDAVIEAAKTFGVGAGASALISGHISAHEQLEQRFASFKQAESALLLPTGYMANLATITALASSNDVVCLDKLNHASLIDAARACGATVRVYPHLHLHKLSDLLERYAAARRRFIVTDSVFSMDGDVADLPALCELADRHDAILVVDEAHGTGVLGNRGAGLSEWQGVSDRVDVVMSTASKALGCLGGIVTARREVIQTLVNRARPYLYSTAPPPTQAAAIHAALDVLDSEPWRRRRLGELASHVRLELSRIGLTRPVADSKGVPTPIIPIITGTPSSAMALAQHLRRRGLFAPAIRPPTVPQRAARVRLTLRADLEDHDVSALIDALRSHL